MAKIYNFQDNLLLFADYNKPKLHKHLAYHLIISLGDKVEWNVDNEIVNSRGICISSNVEHTGNIDKNGFIIFLFSETSKYIPSIKKTYLKNNNYSIINDDLVDNIIETYKNYRNDLENLDMKLLSQCKIEASYESRYSETVQNIFNYIDNLETINHNIMDDLSKEVFLSKSRLSHLFKYETNMTLHSYLAYEKLRKTYWYTVRGLKLTDACILAGFNSSSHFSSTCKKMFGISFRELKI